MTDYLKTFINIRARNIRYLFVVDSKTSISELLDLCYRNHDFWGGRYNPIVPSFNGIIPHEYIKLISHFDPDYIVYNEGVVIENIRDLFHPFEYIKANDLSFLNMEGVDSTYLLEGDESESILQEMYLYKSLPTLYPFYKLNFGFIDSANNPVTRKFKNISVSSENQHELNDLITYGSLSIISTLSAKNVDRPLLQTFADTSGRIELIVSDHDNQLEDLLYYWNRHLYLEHGAHYIKQLFITNTQLDEFIENNNCDIFFAALSGTRDIKISSLSLSTQQLTIIRDKLNHWQKAIKFHLRGAIKFPFDIEEKSLSVEFDEPFTKQSIVGKSDFIHIPDLSFINRHIVKGKWIIDTWIEKDSDAYRQVNIPARQKMSKLFCETDARINKYHSVSAIVSNEMRYITYKNPSEENIFKKLIINYSKQDGILKIDTSDDGMRLNSLVNLFKNNYKLLEYFFVSKYWINIFRGKDSSKQSKRMQQAKGVFSYKDLLVEYENRRGVLESNFHPTDQNNLKIDLQLLVNIGALFIGNKVKCMNCGSKYWYGLNELSEIMKCKGCLQSVSVSIESEVYYKLNEVIKNCVISNSGSKNDFHGNLTVLLYLIETNTLSNTSFYFLPAQYYYVSDHNMPKSDIDIICVHDGKFIIGEAKNSVSEFNKKEIDNLIYLGNEITPDKIVLVFKDGDKEQLKSVIEKIKLGLTNKNILVTSHSVVEYFYISNHIPSNVLRNMSV